MGNYLNKLKNSLPWLTYYPISRLDDLRRRTSESKHVVITIADHFEPAWQANGSPLDLKSQIRELKKYYKLARQTGEALRDADGTKFRHTNFYPAEQYHAELLEIMAEMQTEGLGEVEIHLHHGVEKPDTAENLRNVLTEFRDILAEEHRCLSRFDGKGEPKYAFVHGNLALGNSHDGKLCGVDEEIQILQDTGCYADMTLPSAPDKSQVPMFNKIYECGLPLDEKIPHRKGKNVRVRGKEPILPLIFTGPLMFDWSRRIKGFPVPRIGDGALSANQPMDLARFGRWMSANVTVRNRPEWIFVKLYCHGFFDYDQSASIGEDARRFFSEIIENGEKTGDHKIHFASAREAVNMVFAAIDGKEGNPHDFRDYRLKSIMNEGKSSVDSQKITENKETSLN